MQVRSGRRRRWGIPWLDTVFLASLHEANISYAHVTHLGHAIAIWAVCLIAIVGVLARPFKVPEWIWALGGATVIAAAQLLPIGGVLNAVSKGTDVYLFLTGMMLLAEMARREGVFDWVASRAVRASGGSRTKLDRVPRSGVRMTFDAGRVLSQ